MTSDAVQTQLSANSNRESTALKPRTGVSCEEVPAGWTCQRVPTSSSSKGNRAKIGTMFGSPVLRSSDVKNFLRRATSASHQDKRAPIATSPLSSKAATNRSHPGQQKSSCVLSVAKGVEKRRSTSPSQGRMHRPPTQRRSSSFEERVELPWRSDYQL